MQQSICYDKARGWTISLSWGFTVQIFRGVFLPREMEMPSRTFLNWYRKADYTAYAFNTRPVTRNPCQKPFIFYFSNGTLNSSSGLIVTEYLKDRSPHPFCKWKMADPALLQMVMVFKKPNPSLWDSVSISTPFFYRFKITETCIQSFKINFLFLTWCRICGRCCCCSQAPRRNCCRVMGMEKEGVLSIDVGTCREGEISI